MIVIVDADLDIRRSDEVWLTVGTNACPRRDFVLSDGQARDDDYTPLTPSLASRIGIDATRKFDTESNQVWPMTLKMSDEIAAKVQERWSEIMSDVRP
jgi:4-hydroxy-3-polyprenylbenzoate decarboxylase